MWRFCGVAGVQGRGEVRRHGGVLGGCPKGLRRVWGCRRDGPGWGIAPRLGSGSVFGPGRAPLGNAASLGAHLPPPAPHPAPAPRGFALIRRSRPPVFREGLARGSLWPVSPAVRLLLLLRSEAPAGKSDSLLVAPESVPGRGWSPVPTAPGQTPVVSRPPGASAGQPSAGLCPRAGLVLPADAASASSLEMLKFSSVGA